MSAYQLAQLNIARLLAPLDSPPLADFVANLDRVNALAEQSDGFVWRLQSDAGNATDFDDFGPEYIANMSVWRDVASLHDFVYRSAHIEVLRRKPDWFHKLGEAYMVLWWLPAGHRPSLAEAGARLQLLRAQGPTPDAFSFKKAFPAPDRVDAFDASLDDACPAG